MNDDADLARLATLVAHEMRTPLSVVSGYLKMLASERQGPLTDAQRGSIAGATRACQQLTALAADVSWLARIERREVSPAAAPVSLEALLSDLAQRHVPLDEHPVDVEWVAATPEALTVARDGAHLRRVLEALLAAAIRAAPDHARIQVLARRRGAGVAIALAPSTDIESLLDTDPATLEALDESIGGLGVGLPLAARLVALEGGAIHTRRGPQGLSILVMLPG